MRQTSLNTKGFGLVGVVIILAAVVLVGGAGAYVYHMNHKAKATTSSTSNNNAESTKNTTSTTKTAVPKGTYLDLTQEGVKFLLSNSVSDAVYSPYVSPMSDGSKAYGLSTQKLENAGGGNYCTAAYAPLGIIGVSTSAPEQKTPDNKTLFLIGGKYYRYFPPQDHAQCSAFTVAETQAYQQAVAQSFATLQADK